MTIPTIANTAVAVIAILIVLLTVKRRNRQITVHSLFILGAIACLLSAVNILTTEVGNVAPLILSVVGLGLVAASIFVDKPSQRQER